MTRNQVVARAAKTKEAHPERYCPAPKCLWRTGDGSPCPRHIKAFVHLCPSCGKRVAADQWDAQETLCKGCVSVIDAMPF